MQRRFDGRRMTVPARIAAGVSNMVRGCPHAGVKHEPRFENEAHFHPYGARGGSYQMKYTSFRGKLIFFGS